MINQEELIFVEDFLDSLRRLGVKKIPFNDENYYRGIENIKEVLEKNFSKEYYELKSLFDKRHTSEDYSRMEWALTETIGSKTFFYAWR